MTSTVATRRTRATRILLASAVLMAAVSALLPGSRAADGEAPEFSGRVTAVRTAVDATGAEEKLSSHTVTLTVNRTSDLRGREEVHVSWAGARPTSGVVSDPNSAEAREQEYPMVLLQCRGVDTAGKVPRGQVKLSPETCWTQTSVERYVAAASNTPAWRFDRHAAASDRKAVVGAPDPLPAECDRVSHPLSARWLPFRTLGGGVHPGGPDPDAGCVSLPPESDSAEAGGLPSNTTYGVTGTDGRGQADFAIWTGAENGSLGCSPEVQCALVAVPVIGVSCDAFGTALPKGTVQATQSGTALSESAKESADSNCRRTGAYEPGATKASEATHQSVRGTLWWSESNWRNRITVPLDFATTGAVCDTVSDEAPLEIMGSVVLNELSASWRPTFCTTKNLFPFTHVQQSDSLARQLLERGEVKAAYGTAPPDDGWSRSVAVAPTTVSGFAISFSIDDAANRRVTDLKLNARLVAKLLTSSYPAEAVVRDNHPSIGGNPFNITVDPEFQTLNPGLPQSSSLQSAAALQFSSADSDLMWSLTSWINADPEARQWLNGQEDPWGAVVNENYRKIELPVVNWPLADDFVAPQWYQDQNSCYGNSPTAFMQLIANPPSNLATVILNMQFANSAVATVCKFDGYDLTTLPLRQQGRQKVGYRFVLGLTSLSAAKRYNLSTASLRSANDSYVAPTQASLKAAVEYLSPQREGTTWQLDHTALAKAGTAAYPGTMPVYTVVPTEGLSDIDAAKLSTLLCYTQREGQVPGEENGQLPAGHLPLTRSNGLQALSDQVLKAALAVRAQEGTTITIGSPVVTRADACGPKKPSSGAPDGEPTDNNPSRAGGAPGTFLPGDVPGTDIPSENGDQQATPISAVPSTEVRLTAGEASTLGRLGAPTLLLLALGAALASAWLRFSPALRSGAVGLRNRIGPTLGGRR